MNELDDYGSFNTRYEGVGQLLYLPGDPVHVYFEARQLIDGRLLVACVSPNDSIRDDPVTLDGHLLSGEPFSTMWGRGIKEIYRSKGNINKAHYTANMMRVRYTKAVQPDDRSIKFALHNLIPGRHSDTSANRMELHLGGYKVTISPAGNYGLQADQLLRHGGNLRTSWAKIELGGSSSPPAGWSSAHDVVDQMLIPLSLALGTSVTAPQKITLDAEDNRNDVEHYSSRAALFSDFIPTNAWDSPIKETAEAWFSTVRPQLFCSEELAVSIHQHLDACSGKVYLETRALVAATLLDSLAGRYTKRWSQKEPHRIHFKHKLSRLLTDVGISIDTRHLHAVIEARNSLVHSGRFVTSEKNKTYVEYQNLLLLGRSILLRLVGVPSTLHELIQA
jgi:hypothetical protein